MYPVPTPHPPSSGHLLSGGLPASVSPMASPPPVPACGPLCLLAAVTQIYLFPGLERGEPRGVGGGRGHQGGSQGLPLPPFSALTPRRTPTPTPDLRSGRPPPQPALPDQAAQTPRDDVWRFETFLSSPSLPLPKFLKHFLDFFFLFLLKNKIYI